MKNSRKMRKLSKRTAWTLALAILLGLFPAVIVFSAPGDSGSITINAPPNISIEGQSFTAYQIFELAYDGTNYAYTITPPFQSFTYAGLGIDNTPGHTLKDYLETYPDSRLSEPTEPYLTNALMDYIYTSGEDFTDYIITSAPAVNAEVTISNIPFGYYMIPSMVFDTADGSGTVTSSCMFTTTDPASVLTLMADAPVINKQVSRDNGVTWDNYTDANVGDTVRFQTISQVPYMAGYTSYVFNTYDMISGGLTYKNDIAVKIGGVSLTPGIDYTAEYSTDRVSYSTAIPANYTSGASLYVKITFLNFINYNSQVSSDIEMTYSAALNESAVISDIGNANDTYLEYSNNPYDYNSTGKTATAESKIYTFGINFVKQTANSIPLAGAQFQLYKPRNGAAFSWDASANTANNGTLIKFTNVNSTTYHYDSSGNETSFTTDSTGRISLTGLEAGTYYLAETTAPNGYNKLEAPIKVEISYSYSFADNSAAVTINADDMPVSGDIVVVNRTGVKFPNIIGGVGFSNGGFSGIGVGTGSIVINAPDGLSIAGKEFTVYQLFTLDYYQGIPSMYVYSVTPPFTGFTVDDALGIGIPETLREYLDDHSDFGLTTTESQEIMTKLINYINANSSNSNMGYYRKTVTAGTDNSVTIDNLPLGYYIVMSVEADVINSPGSKVTSSCFTTTTDTSSVITLPADAPVIDNQIIIPPTAKYTDLQSAINSAPDETLTTIILTGDVITTDTVTIPVNKIIELKSADSATYKIDANGGDFPVITNYGNLQIENIIVTGANYTRGSGSGVLNAGIFTMSSGMILNNNTPFKGSGVFNGIDCIFIMNSGTISDNTAGYGGGVYNYNGKFTITGGKIYSNISTTNGGGIYNDNGIFTMTGGEISGNTTTDEGGGIFNSINGTFTMSGGTISNNTATTYGGGGVRNHGTFNMSTNAVISDNTAAVDGGGVHNSGTFNMSGGTISGNTTLSNGGGVYNYNLGTFTMSGGEISSNVATVDGGGIYTTDMTKVTIDGGTFADNKASAAYMWDLTGTDLATHTANITNTTYTVPFQNAYNNADISYAPTDNYIAYNQNIGADSQEIRVGPYVSGSAFPVLKNPNSFGWAAPSGETFLYWSESVNGSAYTLSDVFPDASVTLYAAWGTQSTQPAFTDPTILHCALKVITEYNNVTPTPVAGINVKCCLIATAVYNKANGTISYVPIPELAGLLSGVDLGSMPAGSSTDSSLSDAGFQLPRTGGGFAGVFGMTADEIAALTVRLAGISVAGNTVTTDANGEAVFDNLIAGIYLVAQNPTSDGNNGLYDMCASIVAVPLADSDGLLYYILTGYCDLQNAAGSVTVVKKFSNPAADTPTDVNTAFTVILSQQDPMTQISSVKYSFVLNKANNWTLSISDIVPGIYNVSEINMPGGYELVSLSATQITVAPRNNINITATNQKTPTPPPPPTTTQPALTDPMPTPLTQGVLTYIIDADGSITITGCDTNATSEQVDEALTELAKIRPIAEIADHAFEGFTNLTWIMLPDDLVTIGDYAFYNCANLENVYFGENTCNTLTTIGDYALYGTQITEFFIPARVTYVGENAFPESIGDIFADQTAADTLTGSGYRPKTTPNKAKMEANPPTDVYQYIPYEFTIKTGARRNSGLSFTIDKELPAGLGFDGNTGKIYGCMAEIAQELIDNGFTFTVTATGSNITASAAYTLKFVPATEYNIDDISSDNFDKNLDFKPGIIDKIETDGKMSDITVDSNGNLISPKSSIVMHVTGEFKDFLAFYIDGVEKVRNEDYIAGEGSTIITLTDKTIKDLDEGNYTAAATFRRTDDSGDADIVAQNFKVNVVGGNSNDKNEGNGSGDNGNGNSSNNGNHYGNGNGNANSINNNNNSNNQNNTNQANNGTVSNKPIGTVSNTNQPAANSPTNINAKQTTQANNAAVNKPVGTNSQANTNGTNTVNTANSGISGTDRNTAPNDDGNLASDGSFFVNANNPANPIPDGANNPAGNTNPAITGLPVNSNGNYYFTLDGSGKPMEFRIDIPLSEFIDLDFDGSMLTAGTDYTVRSGSTIVTIPAKYLEQRSSGLHTMGVNFAGKTVSITFELVKSAQPSTLSVLGDLPAIYSGSAAGSAGTYGGNAVKHNPATGESGRLQIYILSIILGVSVAVFLIWTRKRKI